MKRKEPKLGLQITLGFDWDYPGATGRSAGRSGLSDPAQAALPGSCTNTGQPATTLPQLSLPYSSLPLLPSPLPSLLSSPPQLSDQMAPSVPGALPFFSALFLG